MSERLTHCSPPCSYHRRLVRANDVRCLHVTCSKRAVASQREQGGRCAHCNQRQGRIPPLDDSSARRTPTTRCAVEAQQRPLQLLMLLRSAAAATTTATEHLSEQLNGAQSRTNCCGCSACRRNLSNSTSSHLTVIGWWSRNSSPLSLSVHKLPSTLVAARVGKWSMEPRTGSWPCLPNWTCRRQRERTREWKDERAQTMSGRVRGVAVVRVC